MSESEFVTWYINKIYIFTGTNFKRKYTYDNITLYQLSNEIKSSLRMDKVSGNDILSFISNMFRNKKMEYKLDTLDYIRLKYKIVLGYRNWEIVTLSGEPVDEVKIVSDLKHKYDLEFISEIVDEWFENEIVNLTEKSILQFK